MSADNWKFFGRSNPDSPVPPRPGSLALFLEATFHGSRSPMLLGLVSGHLFPWPFSWQSRSPRQGSGLSQRQVPSSCPPHPSSTVTPNCHGSLSTLSDARPQPTAARPLPPPHHFFLHLLIIFLASSGPSAAYHAPSIHGSQHVAEGRN